MTSPFQWIWAQPNIRYSLVRVEGIKCCLSLFQTLSGHVIMLESESRLCTPLSMDAQSQVDLLTPPINIQQPSQFRLGFSLDYSVVDSFTIYRFVELQLEYFIANQQYSDCIYLFLLVFSICLQEKPSWQGQLCLGMVDNHGVVVQWLRGFPICSVRNLWIINIETPPIDLSYYLRKIRQAHIIGFLRSKGFQHIVRDWLLHHLKLAAPCAMLQGQLKHQSHMDARPGEGLSGGGCQHGNRIEPTKRKAQDVWFIE